MEVRTDSPSRMVSLYGCGVAGLLSWLVAGLLGYWVIWLLDYWVARLFSNSVTLQPSNLHSVLNASMGLSRDARIAGYMPNTNPVPAAKTRAWMAVVMVISAGLRVRAEMPCVKSWPTKRPRKPPKMETRTDSARNWLKI